RAYRRPPPRVRLLRTCVRYTPRVPEWFPDLQPAGQRAFTDLGVPLHDVTFVVVDLETTGGPPPRCAIPPIAAGHYRRAARPRPLRNARDPGRPDPADDHRAHGNPRGDDRAGAPDRRRAPPPARVPRPTRTGSRAVRSQPPLRHLVPRRGAVGQRLPAPVAHA